MRLFNMHYMLTCITRYMSTTIQYNHKDPKKATYMTNSIMNQDGKVIFGVMKVYLNIKNSTCDINSSIENCV